MNRYEQSEVIDNQSIFEKGDSFLESDLELPSQYKRNSNHHEGMQGDTLVVN